MNKKILLSILLVLSFNSSEIISKSFLTKIWEYLWPKPDPNLDYNQVILLFKKGDKYYFENYTMFKLLEYKKFYESFFKRIHPELAKKIKKVSIKEVPYEKKNYDKYCVYSFKLNDQKKLGKRIEADWEVSAYILNTKDAREVYRESNDVYIQYF